MIFWTPRIQGVRDTMPQFVRLLTSLSLCCLSLPRHLTTDIPERRWRAGARGKEKKSESSGVRARAGSKGAKGRTERTVSGEPRYCRDIRIHLYADLTRRRAVSVCAYT